MLGRYLYQQLRKEHEVRHSVATGGFSKLYKNMKEKPGHKKVNSHTPCDLNFMTVNKDNPNSERRVSETPGYLRKGQNQRQQRKSMTPTKQDIFHAKKMSEAEHEQMQKELI